MKTASLNLSFCSQNFRSCTDRYDERKAMLKQSILSMNADFYGLQEVHRRLFPGHLQELIHNNQKQKLYMPDLPLSERVLHRAPFQFTNFALDTVGSDLNAIAHNSNFIGQNHQTLQLSGSRNAQRIKVDLPGLNRRMWFVNLHLHHALPDERVREYQTQEVLAWLNNAGLHENDVVVMLGDFNAPPWEATHKTLAKEGYISTYRYINGAEPGKTFPSGIYAQSMDQDPALVLDYIFVKGSDLTIKKASLISTQGGPGERPVYPSDHYGLYAEICIDAIQ